MHQEPGCVELGGQRDETHLPGRRKQRGPFAVADLLSSEILAFRLTDAPIQRDRDVYDRVHCVREHHRHTCWSHAAGRK